MLCSLTRRGRLPRAGQCRQATTSVSSGTFHIPALSTYLSEQRQREEQERQQWEQHQQRQQEEQERQQREQDMMGCILPEI